MTIFAITTNIEFNKKPAWLHNFFKKYNKKGYEFHITLKQPTIVPKNELVKIQNIISKFISTNHPKRTTIDFDKLHINASQKDLAAHDGCIMIRANNPDIIKLQRELVTTLSKYKKYMTPKTKYYEEKFKPHITIAADLSEQEFASAKDDLKDDILVQGEINEIHLIIVRQFNPKLKHQKREIINYKLI
jgi:2'-5' RNA ligase